MPAASLVYRMSHKSSSSGLQTFRTLSDTHFGHIRGAIFLYIPIMAVRNATDLEIYSVSEGDKIDVWLGTMFESESR